MLNATNVDLYYGAAQALRGVSFSAEVGKVSALMGRNGVGKTSFLRAIIGEQPIAGGEIAFDGKVLGRMAPHDRARLGIAYVPQGRDIFPLLTVEENLKTGYAQLPKQPSARSPPTSSISSRCSPTCCAGAAATSPAASSSSSPSAARWSRGRSCSSSTSRPRASSRRSSRTSAAPSNGCATKGDDGDPAGRAVFRLRPPARRHLRGDGPRRDRPLRHPRPRWTRTRSAGT